MKSNLSKISETLFCRKTIKELTEPHDNQGNILPSLKFFIPAYQRGYRWRKEEVKQLLDDIWEFYENRLTTSQSSQAFYCIQPVVVKACEEKLLGDYEVIDGQQRLTTIFIVLQAIQHYTIKRLMPSTTDEQLAEICYSPIYTIDYETRDHSDVWLPKINEASFPKDNIDYYHIHRAYMQTKDWLADKEKSGATDPFNTLKKELLDNVQCIWYEASDTVSANNDAVEIFNRLNSGKIELNNAELIKALLLQERNFMYAGEEKADVTRQAQIALEWDNMEKSLQREDFWWFIYNDRNPLKYDTRLEYIFDLMVEKTRANSYRHTFDIFYDEYQQMRKDPRKFVERKWREVQLYMLTLQQWFEDRVLYHYIGYLIEYTDPQVNLIKVLKTMEQEPVEVEDAEGNKMKRRLSKSEFLERVKEMIRDVLRIRRGSNPIDVVPEQLKYGQSSGIARRILLLYNMQTLLNNANSEAKFPLDLYKKGKWDVEHIASQTDFRLTEENCKDWVCDIVRYMVGVEYPKDNELDAYINKVKELALTMNDESQKLLRKILLLLNPESNKENNRNLCLDEVNKHFQVCKTMDEEQKDYIWNLSLLNASINRSYQNAIFPVKRMYIIRNEANGVFVPLCTKNTFQKVYSRKLDELICWSTQDAITYWEDICRVLGAEKFLSDKVLNHKPSKNKFTCQE